jgi:hypothetical protein
LHKRRLEAVSAEGAKGWRHQRQGIGAKLGRMKHQLRNRIVTRQTQASAIFS